MSDRPRLIGGVFGLEPRTHSPTPPPFLAPPSLLLANARSGLGILTTLLRPARMWMPSYQCPDMVSAVDQDRTELRWFPVDSRLQVSDTRWIDEVNEGDLVVLVSYFGFPIDAEIAAVARARGARVLEDAAQSLLSAGAGRDADFVLFSPRKFLGVPDGGILGCAAGGQVPEVELAPPPPSWLETATEAITLRREFDDGATSREWFPLFREAEATCPNGRYRMSDLSQALLSSFDHAAAAERRIRNYRRVHAALPDIALLPEPSEGVVPLGFPIRVQERNRVRQALFAQEIYPPVHWALAGVVPPDFVESHRLAAEIMTLPCDQRYGPEDMDRMIAAVRRAMRS